MKKAFALLFTIVSLSLSAQVKFLQANDLEDYELVLKSARQSNTLLLLALHDGGGDFRKMYNDGVFNDVNLGQNASAYTKVAININDPMGQQFLKVYSTSELPTFYLMNEEEFVLEVLVGYQKASELSKSLAEVAAEPHRYDSLLVKYNANSLNNAEWVELLELFALNFDYIRTVRLAQEFLNNQEPADLLKKPYVELLAQYGVNLESPYPKLVMSNAQTIKRNVPQFDLKSYQSLAIEYNLDLAILNKDSLLAMEIGNRLVGPPLVNKDSVAFAKLNVYREYAWQSEQFSLYTESLVEDMKNKPANIAANMMFDEAYEIVEKFNSASALNGAMLLAKTADQRQESFKAKMLESYIAYLQKDLNLSNKLLQEARPLIKTPAQLRSLEKLHALVQEDGD